MEVASMDKTDIDSYSLADIKVEFPNPSIAVITYKTSQRGTFDGKDVSGNYYNESVWVKKETDGLTLSTPRSRLSRIVFGFKRRNEQVSRNCV
jgi:hypothetical protein